jgi:hypothetical protein
MRSTLIFLITLLSNLSFSQSSFNNGIAITYKNDTIRGYFKPQLESFNTIAYKKNKDGSSELMKADRIKEVYIDSHKVIVTRMMHNNNDSAKVFLQALVLGTLSLYEGKTPFKIENKGEAFFAIEKEGKLLLISKGDINNYYKIVLDKCYSEKEKFKDYKWGYIETVVNANKCLNSNYSIYFKRRLKKLMLGLVEGYELGSIKNLNSQFISVDNNSIDFSALKHGFRVDLFFTNSLRFSTGLNYVSKSIPIPISMSYGSSNGIYKRPLEGIRFNWNYRIWELPLLFGIEKKITSKISGHLAAGFEGSSEIGPNSTYILLLDTQAFETLTLDNISYGFIYETGIKFTLNKNHFLSLSSQYKKMKNKYYYEIWSDYGSIHKYGIKDFSVNRLSINLGYYADLSKKIKF